MTTANEFTKKMLSKLREGRNRILDEAEKPFKSEHVENDNFLTRSKILMEEAVEKKNAQRRGVPDN
jgi:hypothetical protein